MFVTIRRHQKWLWVVIAGLTIISFLIFGPTNARVTDTLLGRGRSSSHGRINGRQITDDEFRTALAEASLFYFLGSSKWPDKDPEAALRGFNVTRETYFRLFWIEKERELGIRASDQAVADLARQVLAQKISVDSFEATVLQPEGLNLGDFESFLRHELGRQQLMSVAGLSGSLVTPKEAEEMYRKEHQDLNTVAAFFSVTNFLPGVITSPEAVEQYYLAHTNNYFLDRRVQVDYVKYDLTNYLADAQAKITNLDTVVEDSYRQLGTNTSSFGNTPAEVKTSLRTKILQREALIEARSGGRRVGRRVVRRRTRRPPPSSKISRGQTAWPCIPPRLFSRRRDPRIWVSPRSLHRRLSRARRTIPSPGRS